MVASQAAQDKLKYVFFSSIFGNFYTRFHLQQASLSEIQALAQLKDFFGGGLSDDIGRKALDSAKASTGNYDVQFAVNWLLDQVNAKFRSAAFYCYF